MKRHRLQDLIAWKDSRRRKPLILRGARQVGKTWLLREFGRAHFENVVYLDFEQDPALDPLFAGRLDPGALIRNLEIYLGLKIRAEKTLLVFDEVQRSERALNSLKYFAEQAPEFALAAAGSNLGLRLGRKQSFPVGKVSFMELGPLSFLEYLEASEEHALATVIGELDEASPVAEPIHEQLLQHLRRYMLVGGMPEAVACHVGGGEFAETRKIQSDILEAYVLDFAKYATPADAPKLSIVWNSIPRHLARENKKFIFSALSKGARARSYESALSWLADAGLIHIVQRIELPRVPLEQQAQPNSFKVFALDVGLLSAMVKVPESAILDPTVLFEDFRGALAENLVAQELGAYGHDSLYYWSHRTGDGEVDFLLESEGAVYPLEVKSGINPKSKSLRSFGGANPGISLSRATALNLRRNGEILNYPLYALSRFPRLSGSR